MGKDRNKRCPSAKEDYQRKDSQYPDFRYRISNLSALAPHERVEYSTRTCGDLNTAVWSTRHERVEMIMLLVNIQEIESSYSSRRLFQRYFLVSFTITPDNNNKEIRFGTAINALTMSAKLHTRERLTTEPT